MKNNIWLAALLLLTACDKSETGYQNRNNIWPTSITMGNDTTIGKTTGFYIWGYQSSLNACGVQPQYEAPNIGVDVYTLSGPLDPVITWRTVNFKTLPYVSGVVPGEYKFIGHAYVTGYRQCDDSLMNDHAYDTVKIVVSKRKKP